MENTAQTLWDSCADTIRSQVSDIVWQMNFHSAQPTELLDNELILIVGAKAIQVGRLNTEEELELTPDNPNFKPLSIINDEVREVWKIKSNLSLMLHAPKKLADKVSDVESRLLELMQRVDSIEKSSKD